VPERQFWQTLRPMQNDPMGVGRRASATVPVPTDTKPDSTTVVVSPDAADAAAVVEIGGPSGPEPTRFGDWEKNGRCIDF
jgi:hypothetical protein